LNTKNNTKVAYFVKQLPFVKIIIKKSHRLGGALDIKHIVADDF